MALWTWQKTPPGVSRPTAASTQGGAARRSPELDGGEALAPGLRARMERSFDWSFADVRVHANGEAARVTRTLSARALSAGGHLLFAPGEYQPDSPRGRALIAHELAHVVQATRRPSSAAARAAVEPSGSAA